MADVLVCKEVSAVDIIPFRLTGFFPKILYRRSMDRKAHASFGREFAAEKPGFAKVRPADIARYGRRCRSAIAGAAARLA